MLATWHPISTAPKDGRRVLLYIPSLQKYVAIGEWNDDRYARTPRPFWEFETGSCPRLLWMRKNQPSHWSELPGPPT
jgi:hypothetical protein